MATAYTVLGVLPTASQEEVAAAFRARSIDCHPDRATGDADRAARTAKMAKLTLAWRYLGDPESRASYDRKLAGFCADATPAHAERLDVAKTKAEASRVAGEISKLAGLDDAQARAVAQKAADMAGGLAELASIVRGLQR